MAERSDFMAMVGKWFAIGCRPVSEFPGKRDSRQPESIVGCKVVRVAGVPPFVFPEQNSLGVSELVVLQLQVPVEEGTGNPLHISFNLRLAAGTVATRVCAKAARTWIQGSH